MKHHEQPNPERFNRIQLNPKIGRLLNDTSQPKDLSNKEEGQKDLKPRPQAHHRHTASREPIQYLNIKEDPRPGIPVKAKLSSDDFLPNFGQITDPYPEDFEESST